MKIMNQIKQRKVKGRLETQTAQRPSCKSITLSAKLRATHYRRTQFLSHLAVQVIV